MNVVMLIRELQKHPENAAVLGEGFVLGNERLVRVAYDPEANTVHLIGERDND